MIGFEFEKALKFLCTYFHESENLKKPTIFHSVRVGTFLWNLGYNEKLQIAGLLHDSLEDTTMTESFIQKEFGSEVLAIVQANTKNINLDKSERNEDIIRRCAEYGKDAIVIKVADVYDNFLFYISEGNILEIERCKKLANLISIHRHTSWNDPIFSKISEIQLYNNA